MGTNYYIRNIKTKQELHIGKSSAGWQFCFKVNKEYNSNLRSLIKYISNSDFEIITEYGEKITIFNFQNIIKNSVFGYNFKTYYKEHPEEHPNVLDIDFIADDGSWWTNCEFC